MRPSSSSSSSSSSSNPETLTLIPNLPNDISTLILTFIPYSHHARLKSISRSWNQFFSSKALIPVLRHKNPKSQSHLICIFPQDPSLTPPYLYDPHNHAWCPLPPMPPNPHAYGLSNFTSVSLDHHLYVLGGSLFDTRSYPMDRPCSSSSSFRFDLVTHAWDRLSPMLSARGSFACAAVDGEIIVAGGGSRHHMFGAAGSRISSVERYDVDRNEWVSLDGLPRFRAGCVGFLVGKEFWVMGGYGESRTISGVFPVDEYYKDGVVLELKTGGKWREIDNMWQEGERKRLGNVVVLDGEQQAPFPRIFMLDENTIFRYDFSTNRWQEESTIPRKGSIGSTFGFVALDEELYVLSPLKSVALDGAHKRFGTLFVQIYHPRERTWRSMTTRPPSHFSVDFKTAVMCTIRI